MKQQIVIFFISALFDNFCKALCASNGLYKMCYVNTGSVVLTDDNNTNTN
uniref:Uncharacterized protein n=1 Tax=Anguilla anguilla TaxID=7936 RepID=A0A0E9RLU9_ANGAN